MSRYIIVAVIVLLVLAEGVYELKKTGTKPVATGAYQSSHNRRINGNQFIYTHPQLGYTFEYPAEWKLIQSESVSDPQQAYLDVTLESPGLRLSPLYSEIETGCRITVKSGRTTAEDVNEYIAINSSWRRLAKNTTDAYIADTKAIQFENGYEANHTHITVFMKKNTAYVIEYRYADSLARSENWHIFADILSSFSTE